MDRTYSDTNLNETLQRFNFKLSKILTHSLKKEIEYTKESLRIRFLMVDKLVKNRAGKMNQNIYLNILLHKS